MRRRLTLEGPLASSPEVARWIAALQDCRRRTLELLDEASPEHLDRPAPAGGNGLGTLLYHIAAIEADWLFTEILEGGKAFPEAWFPFDVRDAAGRLTEVTNLGLADHLDRLASVRSVVLDELRAMASEEFHRVRTLPDYDVAPDWVLHHLMQHEAEHRAQIAGVLGRSEA